MLDPLPGQKPLQFVDVSAVLLDFPVLRLVDVPDQEVDGDLILWKLRGDLFAEEGPGQLGDLQASIDPIVIREGDKRHPLRLQAIVDLVRIRVTVRKLEPPKNPLGGAIAEFGVNVKVNLGGHSRRDVRSQDNK